MNLFAKFASHFTRNDTIVFFISFCVGILFVCLVESKPEIIVRWPTPENAGLVKYIDRGNNCYEYEPEKVECTHDATTIPVQNGDI